VKITHPVAHPPGEQVPGAIAFYLGNQEEVDAYLADGERTADSQHLQSRKTNAELIAKLQRARNDVTGTPQVSV